LGKSTIPITIKKSCILTISEQLIVKTDTEHCCFARDAAKYRAKLFSKVPGSQSRCGLASNKMIDIVRKFLTKLLSVSQMFFKGLRTWECELSFYVVVGIRPDYHSRGVMQYVFNKDMEEGRRIRLEDECLQIMKQLEKRC